MLENNLMHMLSIFWEHTDPRLGFVIVDQVKYIFDCLINKRPISILVNHAEDYIT